MYMYMYIYRETAVEAKISVTCLLIIYMYMHTHVHLQCTVHCEREAWTRPDVIYVQVPVKASLGKLCLVASLWALFPCPELLSTGHPSGGLVWVHAFLQ